MTGIAGAQDHAAARDRPPPRCARCGKADDGAGKPALRIMWAGMVFCGEDCRAAWIAENACPCCGRRGRKRRKASGG
jgi:hypothetical protein